MPLVDINERLNMSKTIPLTKGKVAFIDDEDFERVNKYSWYAQIMDDGRCYACSRINGDIVYMHRFIMNTPSDMDTDHINDICHDNQKSNLRICTVSQNMINRRKRANTSSEYKGVYWDKSRLSWCARIYKDYTCYYLGSFLNEVDAAKAYDKAAIRLHGEFARLNFS
jgi:AP2 domain